MPMKTVQLAWNPSGRRPGAVAVATWLVLGALVIALALWNVALRRERIGHERELARSARPSVAAPRQAAPARTAAAERQLRDQIVLLNRDWSTVLDRLVPAGRDTRLLGLDINPATGAIRVVGHARSGVAANAYATALGQEPLFAEVRLLLVERRADGVRFEVGARWND